jgi:hypothetical protein
MRKCLGAAASASAAPARILWVGSHHGVEAQENKSLHLKSLLGCGATRGSLGRRGCKPGTAFRDFR